MDVCSDGSVLVTSFNASAVRRLMIDGAGNLTDTGESAFVQNPNNVFCAPGGKSAVAIETFGDEIVSLQFRVSPGWTQRRGR